MFPVGTVVALTSEVGLIRDVMHQCADASFDDGMAEVAGLRGEVVDTRSGSASVRVTFSVGPRDVSFWFPLVVLERVDEPTYLASSRPRVGARVRVKSSVTSPKYGWGSVSSASVGVLKSINGAKCTVDFDEQKDWIAAFDEIELMDAPPPRSARSSSLAPAPRMPSAATLSVGSRVRVKRSVAEPAFGWGSVTHSSVGTIISIDPRGKCQVDFPEMSSWAAMVSELEVASGPPPAAAPAPLPPRGAVDIAVGTRVKVRSGLSAPRFGWGSVKPDSVGVVSSISGDNVVVQFPEQKDWSAAITELEAVVAVPCAPYVGDWVCAKPDVAWGALAPHHIGKLLSIDGDLSVTVDFNSYRGWRGRWQDLNPAPPCTLSIGDTVRVGDGITPTLGWGCVSKTSVGTVLGLEFPHVVVNFPESSAWRGLFTEVVRTLDAPRAGGGGAAAGVAMAPGGVVRIKASVTAPRLGWGGYSHATVGTVAEVVGETCTLKVSGSTETWVVLSSELEALPVPHPEVPDPIAVTLPAGGKAILRRALSASDECVVCMEKKKEATLVHGGTGHLCVCMDCAVGLHECPICRRRVETVVHTF